jgi:hypothetical protein
MLKSVKKIKKKSRLLALLLAYPRRSVGTACARFPHLMKHLQHGGLVETYGLKQIKIFGTYACNMCVTTVTYATFR